MSEWVFPTRSGTPYDRNNVRRRGFLRALRASRLGGYFTVTDRREVKFSDHFIDQRVIIRAGGAPQTQPIVVAARNATPRDRSWLTFSGQVWHGGAVSTEHRVAETTTFSTSRPSNRRRLRRQLVRNVHFHMVGNIHPP